ncbi:hypothetical protein EVAR_96929_1 [Eumeta japonica]|uniref:Uncharacterized protein n=1 Tax=Eumeta variegata TaxID=151549 RepID=A0A4C1TAG6_EUMVA|nr:hypothetical protein EVAR_96929_1 [Eumeta japonica]
MDQIKLRRRACVGGSRGRCGGVTRLNVEQPLAYYNYYVTIADTWSVPTDLTKRTLENQKIRAKIEKPTQWWKEFGFTRGRSVINADAVLVQQIFGAWENSQDVVVE